MKTNSKKTRALALRDSALTIVKWVGTWKTVGPAKVLMARVEGFEIGYRTLSGLQRLPYALDVWTSSKKVLNIEWDTQGNITLVSLRPGAWQDELVALAKIAGS